jgi:hypothetical protein
VTADAAARGSTTVLIADPTVNKTMDTPTTIEAIRAAVSTGEILR